MTALDIADLAVLVVEPSRAQALVLGAHLGALGVTGVRYAADAATALAELGRAPADLVISTMHLPDGTGAELIQRLRADPALALLPFMLVCSEKGYKYLEPVRQAGAVAILDKPVDEGRLRQALYSTLDLIVPEDLAAVHPEIVHFNVLVVDDSPTARALICSVLENLGVRRLSVAENGRAAMERVDSEVFDLVVTDLNMPEMDGEALVRYIREESNQPELPVLLVTSETNESRLTAVQQAGVSALCNKPFEPAVVRDILERVLTFGRV